MVGAIASRYRDGFNKLTESSIVFTISLIAGSFLLYIVTSHWEYLILAFGKFGTLLSILAQAMFHICLAIVAIAVIRPWSERVYGADTDVTAAQRRWADIWQLVGRKSLAIYLLHYFLLFPMGICRDALLSMNLGFVPLFFFSATVATCIIVIVLGINAIIERSPFLALVLTGTVPKKRVKEA